jgi:signal transduction histidine kinase
VRYGTIGGWRRAVAVGLPAVLVALSGVATQWLRVTGRATNQAVTTATAISGRLAEVLQRLTDVESGERAYLLTADASNLGPWQGAEPAVETDLDSLRALIAGDSLETRRIGMLQHFVDARLGELSGVVTAALAAAPSARARAVGLSSGRATMDSLRSIVVAVRGDEDQLIARKMAEGARRRVTLNIVVVVGTTLAFFVALFVNALLTGYVQDRDRSAALLARQATELEQHNTALRQQAADLEAANLELESTTRQLTETTAELVNSGAERERARQAAEMANRAKSDFLATMSHELRTPLNAIVGYASLLEDGVRGSLSPDQTADVARIRRASRHLLGLINDVLNFARLDAGQVNIERTPVPVDETLSTATAMMEIQAKAKGVSLIRVPCSPAIIALADHDKMLQVVVNLLSNAVKFTGAGGRIDLLCTVDGTVLHITVADTGRGIADRDLARIFEPFVQIARELNTEGVGLGLAISRDLARAMGGDLTVRSAEGEGSMFTLTVPKGEPALRGTPHGLAATNAG